MTKLWKEWQEGLCITSISPEGVVIIKDIWRDPCDATVILITVVGITLYIQKGNTGTSLRESCTTVYKILSPGRWADGVTAELVVSLTASDPNALRALQKGISFRLFEAGKTHPKSGPYLFVSAQIKGYRRKLCFSTLLPSLLMASSSVLYGDIHTRNLFVLFL